MAPFRQVDYTLNATIHRIGVTQIQPRRGAAKLGAANGIDGDCVVARPRLRPRNFGLEIEHPAQAVVDLGEQVPGQLADHR